MEELITQNKALLDKISLYGFTVEDIDDIQKLERKGVATVKTFRAKLVTKSGEMYSSINIGKTKYFDCFIYSLGKKGQIYANLELSVRGKKYENLNCNTLGDYTRQLVDAKKFLAKEYGIHIDISKIRFRQMEINKTIEIDEEFENYQRPLSLMMSLLPPKKRFQSDQDWNSPAKANKDPEKEKKRTQTYKRSTGKNGLTLEFYNKTKELKKNHNIDTIGNYLRVELKINSPKKIRQVLGSNELSKLNDKNINDYLNDFIRECLTESFAKNRAGMRTVVKRIMLKNYREFKKSWISDTVIELLDLEIARRIPYVLSANELLEILDEIDDRSKQCRYNARNTMRKICNKHSRILSSNDDERMKELIDKLSQY